MISLLVAPPGAMMSIAFDSDEVVLSKLCEKLSKMTDEELIRFGKEVRRLAENPFQKQLDESGVETDEGIEGSKPWLPIQRRPK
jgi:hypothetical protein